MGSTSELFVPYPAGCNRPPQAEELRMVQAIAHTAFQEAGLRGAYRASFRGFYIDAVRWAMPQGYAITLDIRHAAMSRVRGVLIVPTPAGQHGGWAGDPCSAGFDCCARESIAAPRVI